MPMQIDLQDSGGTSALMLSSKYYEVAELLLEKGAQIDLQDSYGRSALMYA